MVQGAVHAFTLWAAFQLYMGMITYIIIAGYDNNISCPDSDQF